MQILMLKQTKLTPDTGVKTEKNNSIEPHQTLRRSHRLPFAKQTKKLGVVPYRK